MARRRSRLQAAAPPMATAYAAGGDPTRDSRAASDHDLRQLHLAHRYDTTQLRAKMPWYRNSFEDTAPPFAELQQEPLEMDPPLAIPKDLRPLGAKRRYLRTVQLISDPLPLAALAPHETDVELGVDGSDRAVPFEKSLRRPDRGAGARYVLQKANSHATLPNPLRRTPAADPRATEQQHGRRAAQQLSLEEMEDLPNYKSYFGAHAKQGFYAQYRNLHSRPYLFVEAPERRDAAASPPSSTDSRCVPAYPSSKELQHVTHELAPFGAAVAAGTASESAGGGTNAAQENAELPTRDQLSPRSLFLTSCVAKPQLAVPVMLRKRMTKVFDFSFQSLGDTFIAEFARCLVQELPFVEEILVRDNRLSDAGLNALLEAVSAGSAMLSLLRLDISQNEVGAASARTLRSYVASPHCTLATLLVDNADIDDRECAAFMGAFGKNLSVKRLCLSRNRVGEMEHLNVVQPGFTTGGEAIASMLHQNFVLVHLDLSWNYLRLESSVVLANSMRDNATLKELNVAYNACGDAGAMAFGEALRFNQSLEVLDLSYNSIGCKGALVLANAVRVSQTLRSLQLNGNTIGREGGQLVLAALCENHTESGCDVGLRACNLSSSMLPQGSAVPAAAATSNSAGDGNSGVASADTGAGMALPVYSLAAAWIFNPKEPTGRYALNMSEAYDRMVLMELVRLAKYKKGCRFVKVEHWPGGAAASTASRRSSQQPPPGGARRTVQLVRRELVVEQPPPPPVLKRKIGGGNGATAAAEEDEEEEEEENSLETRGLDALFANIDRDKSGAIDQAEVMTVLNRIGLFPHVENLSAVLEAFDYNRSGFLEEREFSAFLFHAVFQLIDVDRSGKIDADEMEDAFKMLGIAAYDHKDIAAAIATYDISGDGEIEESEFVEFMNDSLLEKIKLQVGAGAATGGGGDHHHKRARVTLMDSVTQRAWAVPESGRVELEFLCEREAFASNDEAHRLGKLSQFGIEQLIRNLMPPAASRSEQDELFRVAIHDSDLRFLASQAYQVLEACGYARSPDEHKRIEMIALVLPQMLTTKEAQVLVSRTLTTKQRYRLKAELGSAYSVVLGNPTAHYSFDLSKPKDRLALNKIAEVAQSEKLFSRLKSGRADTSQHGNWENFRNEELDGQPVVLTSAFFLVLPRRGKLAFDYVSTARPKRGTAPMSARRFEQLIEELKTDVQRRGATAMQSSATSVLLGEQQEREPSARAGVAVDSIHAAAASTTGDTHQPSTLATAAATPTSPGAGATNLKPAGRKSQFWDRTRASVAVKPRGSTWKFVLAQATSKFLLAGETREDVGLKLVQIESAICDRWLSCEQAAAIIACMPSAFHARPETTRLLFSRLIDLGSFCRIYDALAPEDQGVCAKTLGWLNMCNPMEPERSYALDVSVWDEREMTKLLVELAIAEPGENWINQSFAPAKGEPGIPGWKLPVRWEKDNGKEGGVNRSGFLEVEYYSGQDRGCAKVPAFRKTLLKRTLCGTRQYCL
ncbi:hypothetical protein PybrP1_011334 [[Pythium] brassicae (nom. inval.)]|nr:hypothetical protein PybrP1_011334 [[Pythium] brassicae (nom. inval.)]